MTRRSKLQKTLILFTSALIVLLGLTGCGKKEPEKTEELVRPVKSLVIEKVSKTLSRSFPGTVRSAKLTVLSFKVSGPLIQLVAKEGSPVKEGELLAQIDPRDFKKNLAGVTGSLKEAKAKLKAMKKGARAEDIKILKAQQRAAKARMEEAEINYTRFQKLFDSGSVSKARRDRAETARESARADYNVAQQNLNKGKAGARAEDVEAAEANIRSLETKQAQAQDALNDTNLEAPFSGLITQKHTENFQQVKAKEPIFTLQDLSLIEIEINLPESLIAVIKNKGSLQAQATFPFAPDRHFELEIVEFSAEADPQTRTYRAVGAMTPQKGVNILPGMTASVQLTLKSKAEEQEVGFTIPAKAVFSDPDGGKDNLVWVIDPQTMTVKTRTIKTGDMAGKSIKVLEGLKEGERLVTAGVHYLQEGVKVRLLNDTPKNN